MPQSTGRKQPSPRRRATFAERMCSHHGRPREDFAALAWQCGTSWLTRFLRPPILCLAPRYFEAEDIHLERAAECRWRQDVVEEIQLMRVSYLRRGGWRFFGVGLDGTRLLKYYDHLVALQVIEHETLRIADAESRADSAIPTQGRSLS